MIQRVYGILLNRGIRAEVQYPANTAMIIADAIREKGLQAETWGDRIGVTATANVSLEDKLWTIRRTVGSLIVDHEGITFTGFRLKKKPGHAGNVLDAVIDTLRGLSLDTGPDIESSTPLSNYIPSAEG